MAATMSDKGLGDILVIGGCGFLGYHLVTALLNESDRGQIFVASRKPDHNLIDGITYLPLDILDAAATEELLRKLQPRTIFNVASPVSADMAVDQAQFDKVNVGGMQNIIDAARNIPAIRGLVSTSTVSVAKDDEHWDIDEEYPYLVPGVGGRPYYHSKVAQEKMLLAAHSPELATVSIRLCLVYGERDIQFVPGMLKAVYGKKTNVQLGENKKKLDTVYAPNAANAHILAAKALIDPRRANGPVAGEAFIITDGNPTPFWDIGRIIFKHAGEPVDPKKITVIPGWLALTMANVAEWVYWLFTFGTKKPQDFNRLIVIHIVNNFTYSIEKARRVLGYNPVPNLEGGLRAAVRYEQQVNPPPQISGKGKEELSKA